MRPVMLLTLIVMVLGTVLADLPLPPREAANEAEILRRIQYVFPKFQDAFNEEYVNMVEEGKLLLDAELVSGHYRHWHCSADAYRVMDSLFKRNKEMAFLCSGLPLERLLLNVQLPPWSAFPCIVRQTFRAWAEAQMNDVDEICRHIIFDWQFHCCEAEKRPWRTAFSRFLNKRKRNELGSSCYWFDRVAEKDSPYGFEDLRCKGDVAAFALKWYERALAAGYIAKDHDKLLAGRFRDGLSAKDLGVYVSGEWIRRRTGKVAGVYGDVSPFTLRVDGVPSDFGLEIVSSYLREWNKRRDYLNAVSNVRFIDADDQAVFKTMRAINSMEVRDSAAGLRGWDELITLSFEKCILRDLSFLRKGSKYESLSFHECTIEDFSLISNVDTIDRLSLTKLKSEVDLSPIRFLKSISTLDVSHTVVTNVIALSGHSTMERIVMEGVQGPFDWDSVIVTLPKLKTVKYDNTKIPIAKRTAFKRVVRRSSRDMRHGDRLRPDEELHLAVMDNDSDEVARLLSAGVSAKKEWENLLSPRIGYGCELVSGDIDVEIVKMLLDAGATATAAMRKSNHDILWDLCSGPGATSNCVEVMCLLLNRGCDPHPRKGRESPIGGIRYSDKITQFHVSMVRTLLDRGDESSRSRVVLKSLSERYTDEIDYRAELVELLLNRGKWSTQELTESLNCALTGKMFPTSRKIALLILKAGAPVPANGMEIAEEVKNRCGKNIGKTDRELIRLLEGRITETTCVGNAIDLHANFAKGVYRFKNGPSMLSKDIDIGVNVNAVDKRGNSPLVSLIKSQWSGTNLMALVEMMLEHGADPNLVGRHGETPLTVAVKRFNARRRDDTTNVVALLCQHGANPLANGWRCALAAALRIPYAPGKVELVHLLIDACRPASKMPAQVLISSANADFGPEGSSNRMEIVKKLVEMGAPVTDYAVCAGWWNDDVRNFFLDKCKKKQEDFVAAQIGSARIVRAIPVSREGSVGVDEHKRRKSENLKSIYEDMIRHERCFEGVSRFGVAEEMYRHRIQSRLSALQKRHQREIEHASGDRKTEIVSRVYAQMAEESNRVMRVYAMFSNSDDTPAISQGLDDRHRAWSVVESAMKARGVKAFKLEELRTEYELDTLQWKNAMRKTRKSSLELERAVEECIQWLNER